MPATDPHENVMPSVLDRLINPDSMGTRALPGARVADMTDSVQRDLENLLNTRQSFRDLADRYPGLKNSLIGYGFPDLAGFRADTPADLELIRLTFEEVIATYELRLSDVRVTLKGGVGESDRSLRLHIDAKLRLDPAPSVSFDALLELTTGRARVTPSGA
jgi:type VI secretion system protein ImpF